MILTLDEVPHNERHLLYCTELMPRRQSRRQRRGQRTPPPMKHTTSTDSIIPSLVPLAAGLDAAGISAGIA